MKGGVVLLLLILVLTSSALAIKIDQEVTQKIAQEGQVSVIVVLKDQDFKRIGITSSGDVLSKLRIKDKKSKIGIFSTDYDLDLKHQYSLIKGFSGTLTESGLEKLREDPSISGIFINQERHIFLSNSVPLIQANQAWNISVGGININGSGQTACILDTGVNYNHTDLGGGWGNKVVGGYDYVNNDADPWDDQGHGTHVAGIVASTNNTYKGAAPEAKIFAIKVCDSSGTCYEDDILAGIQDCINNATTYNISVISMSLGGGLFTSYCDNNENINPTSVTLINLAVNNNITVVTATGNTDSVCTGGVATGISWPACVTNATRVTGTDNSDVMGTYACRHYNFTDTLAAPGKSIVSLSYNGGITTKTGTSMSTPHVSGAALLLQQYYRLTHNASLTPAQIKQILNNTGKAINDSSGSGLNFSRINIYSAILSQDNVGPEILFSSPQNNRYYNSAFTLNLTISDNNNLSVSSYNITNTSESILQSNQNNSINQNTFTWNDFVNLSNSTFNEGNYTLTVFANDSLSNTKTSSINFILDKTAPDIIIIQNQSEPVYNNHSIVFRINVTEVNLNLSSVYFESNFSSNWTNYSMNNENNITFNFTLTGTTNLTNQRNIAYQFHVADLAENTDTSNTFNFTVQNRNPTLVNITSPLNGSTLEIGNLTNFTSVAIDPDGDSLTYNWSINETNVASTQNTTYQFNTSGNYLILLTVSDGYEINYTNVTITVNDTNPPSINSLSYDSQVHLQQDVNETIIIVLQDYSGISNLTLYYNNTPVNSSCNTTNSSWNCTWILSNLSVGNNYNFTLNFTDNFTTSNSNSSIYYFNVTSCSDGVQNGNEGGIDCGGSCSTSCSSSSSSSSSSSGGGGGGGGGGGTTTSTFVLNEEQFQRGYSNELGKGDRIKVIVSNEEHYLTLNQITTVSAQINVTSTLQQATLLIGEEKRFEVSGDNYYDMKIKLNGISSALKANFTLYSIHELIKNIPKSNLTSVNQSINVTIPIIQNLTENESSPRVIASISSWRSPLMATGIGLSLLLLILLVIYLRLRGKNKRKFRF